MTLTTTTIEVLRPSKYRAEVWLNRPTLRNAFNDVVFQELSETFAALSRDESLRVILIGGRGKAFCAGGDLAFLERSGRNSFAQNRTDALAAAEAWRTIEACPIPIVGRVQGDVYGGGNGLAALCDVVVASEEATFCLSEVKLGLLPATIGPYVIRAMGVQAARYYMISGKPFNAKRAYELGVVHELCRPDEIDATVESVIERFLNNGPTAVRDCKKLVRNLADRPIEELLRQHTADVLAEVMGSVEGLEGLRSFFEKRPPSWHLKKA